MDALCVEFAEKKNFYQLLHLLQHFSGVENYIGGLHTHYLIRLHVGLMCFSINT